MEKLLNFNETNPLVWCAKHIKSEHERIEVRKTFEGVQLLIVVYKQEYLPSKPVFPEYDGGSKEFYWKQANIFYSADCKEYKKRHRNIQISANGKIDLTFDDFWDINEVVKEAIEILL